jgi:phosphonate transport system substrate-binding protein
MARIRGFARLGIVAEPLRLLTYLSPSIPAGLFELVAEEIQARTGGRVSLDFETSVSGPTPETDPFAQGRADVAFVCGPSYPLLRAAGRAVTIVPAAPVFDDPRNGGRPVYFSDLIVRRDLAARSVPELRGSSWVYNDRQSLSGWHRMLSRLDALGLPEPEDFFARVTPSGSHVSSIDLVARGEADLSAVDSNTLLLARRRDPALDSRIRVLESWGPSAVQPLIAREDLPDPLRAEIARVLLTMADSSPTALRLRRFGVLRFAPVSPEDYPGLSFRAPSFAADVESGHGPKDTKSA